MVLCDSPAGYVTRITPLKPIVLPEEVDDVSIKLLSMLRATYQARLVMEESNRFVRKTIIEADEEEVEEDLLLSPYFSIEANKRKRRRSNDEYNEV